MQFGGLFLLCMCVGVWSRVYLSPGSVVEENGDLWYVDQFVYVSVELQCIEDGPANINVFNKSLIQVKEVLANISKRDHDFDKIKGVIKAVNIMVERVENRLEKAALWFPGLIGGEDLPLTTTTLAPKRRRKRAVIAAAAVGLSFAVIAGISIASLVKVINLEKVVEEQGQKIENIQQNLENIQEKVNDIIGNLTKVQSSLEKLSQDFDTMVSVVYLQLTLNNIEQETNYIIDCIHTQAELVQDAVQGKVSPKLIPRLTLLNTLKNAAYQWGFKSLFPKENLWNYYAVIEGLLSTKGVVIKIPMATEYIFQLFNIYPFPSFHDDEVIKLNSNDLILVSSKRYYACVERNLIDSCVRVNNSTICTKPRFAVKFRRPPFDCCYELAMNATNTSMCEFEKATPTASVLLLQMYIAVFAPTPMRADLRCNDGRTHAKSIVGTTLVNGVCSFTTSTFFYPGVSVKMKKLVAPEFRSHRVMTPGNLSYLAIPHGYKYDRIDKLVLIRDNAWVRHFSPSIRFGLTLGLAGLMVVVCVVLGCLIVYVCRRKRSQFHPEQIELEPQEKSTEEKRGLVEGGKESLVVVHKSA